MHFLKNTIYQYCGEKWRASLAIGYASKKEVFSFPWTNTVFFNNVMLSGSVFRFFKKMREENIIIILPTSRRENVESFVDCIMDMNNPEFKYVAAEDPRFKL